MKVKLGKTLLAAAAALAGASASADPFGAPPDAKHAWAVHDDYRPGVKKITAEPGKAPSDAVVLFDGTKESLDNNWCDREGKPSKWKVDENGDLVSVRGAGYIFSRQKFGDCQLHVEWASPKDVNPNEKGQMRGNSGVFIMGNYEVQVLDSYETDPSKTPNPNPNYSDGQAGAIYGQNPPAVNPCRAPGEFNTYDIIFHSPVYGADGEVVQPATVTVLFNGVLVQDHWKYDGPTGFRRRASYARNRADTGLKREDKMPIAFQDHGNPVHFRNVWIREIPRPEDNVTHGNYYAKEDKVMEQRKKTAAMLEAQFSKWDNEKIGRRLFEAWRVATYESTPERVARALELEKLYLAELVKLEKRADANNLGVDHWSINGYYEDLVRLGFVSPDNAVLAKLKSMK